MFQLLGVEILVLDSHRSILLHSRKSCPGHFSLVYVNIVFHTSYSKIDFLFTSFMSACLGLTSRSGFWGKELPEYYVGIGVLLAFHYTTSGDVMFNVNGQDEGVFFKGVDARTPLWFSVDIFSNTTAVQFVGNL